MARGSSIDVGITIAAHPRKRVYAHDIKLFRLHQNWKASGIAPVGSSEHSQLAVSLLSALRSISNKQLAMIGERSDHDKPLVSIQTNDARLADALRAIVDGQPTPKTRVGRNFLSDLAFQLRRFDVTIQTLELTDRRVLSLASWGRNNLFPSDATESLAVFQPCVVSVAV